MEVSYGPDDVYPVPDSLFQSLGNRGEEIYYYRSIKLVPNWILFLSNISTSIAAYSLFRYVFNNQGFDGLPRFFRVCYVTGFNKIPVDLTDYVGKKVAVRILEVAGDSIAPGVQSRGVGTEGLNQNVSYARSTEGNAFAGSIRAHKKSLQEMYRSLKKLSLIHT